MTTLITGIFQQQNEAQQAMSDLASAGFAVDQTTTFYAGPPGQHDIHPVGGDEDASAGAEHASGGAVSGIAVGGAIGAAVGVATLPILGPGAAIAGAGVGAYVGSLYGALGSTETTLDDAAKAAGSESPHLQSGMIVAAGAPNTTEQISAVRILRARGAKGVYLVEGKITAGEWTDFNPLAPLQSVEHLSDT